MVQRLLLRSLQTAARQTPIAALPKASSPFQITRVQPIQANSQTAVQGFLQARKYSAEAAKKEDSKDETKPAGETSELDTVKKELEAKKSEVSEMTDRVMRTVADYRNLQEQTKREVQAAKDFALQRFAKDLLDSIDNLDRALSTVPAEQLTDANKDLVNLHSGLKMTETILLQTLKKHGLERFDPAESSDKFDPNKMEATFQAPQPGKEDGTAFFTQSKGFTLNGRVLRAAKVGVVRNA